MRVAILADIHGNRIAFEAVLEAVARLRVDRTVIAGDIVNGAPDSLACWQLALDSGAALLRGNHERYVYDYGTERARPEWATLQFAPVQFTVAQVGEAVRARLSELPTEWIDPSCPDLRVVHASPRNDSDHVFPYTSDAEMEVMFGGVRESWVVRAHNHYAGVRLWRGGAVVTSGSVGLPLDGNPKAQFLILERTSAGWQVEHHAVAYDLVRALARFRETGYLETGGPLAHLYLREVETGSFHIIPFLKFQTAFLARDRRATLLDAWVAYQKRGY